MILTEQERELLKRLEENGIGFHAGKMCGGELWLSADDLPRYLQDPLAFNAEIEGVSVSQLRQFLEATEDLRCTSLTRKGTRCSRKVWHWPDNPREFNPALYGVCDIHREHGVTYEKRVG
jgi:hypothetical protein